MKKITIFVIIIDFLALVCFFLAYGPFGYLRNLLVTTAMRTKTHQYFAYTLYSEKKVSEIMNQNYIIPLTDSVDLGAITIDPSPKLSYDNEYDEEVLTRDEGNEDYKYIKTTVGGYDAHIIAIYDPSKVKTIVASKFNNGGSGEQVKTMCNKANALVCINAGGFVDWGYGSDIPMGYIIKDGKIIWSDNNGKGNLIGFNNENKLVLVKATGEEALEMGIRDAIEFGPFLIINGERMKSVGLGGGYGRASRVAIAQRQDGVVLFLVTEGTHAAGPTLDEVIDTLLKYGAVNAANLDGGTSTTLVIKGSVINSPKNVYGNSVNDGQGRYVVSGFGLIP